MIEGENGKISRELFDITRQTLDCYISDIRADILMLAMQYEEDKPIYKCLCCGSIEEVTNHICKKCYDDYCVKMGHAMIELWKEKQKNTAQE
jgi:peptide subunit release factor 1 (eRF1)